MNRTAMFLLKNISSKNTLSNCMFIRHASTVNIASVGGDVEGWDNAAPFESLPGPKPLPLIGNMYRFMPGGELHDKPLSEVYDILRNRYGNIFKFSGVPGRYDMIMVFDPEIIQKIYRTEGQHPIRYGLESLEHYRKVVRKEMFPNLIGLASAQGKQWHYVRSRVNQPMIQPRTVKKYVKPVDEISQAFINKMLRLRNEQNEMPDDFWKHLNGWALESIGRVALDTRLGCLEDNVTPEIQEFINNIHLMFDLMYQLDVEPSLWKIIPTPNYYKLIKVFDHMSEVTIKCITEATERLENSSEIKSEDDLSVLEKLIKIEKEVAVVMTAEMMMAGVDTTSSAVSMLLYYLATNQDKQDILREELTRIMPNKHSPITEEIRQSMPYLRACIKESLRLMPIAPGNLRVSQQDLVLGGYQIPKGTALLLGHMTLSRSENEFRFADKFIPERWLSGKKASAISGCPVGHNVSDLVPNAKDAHPFTYMPFGFGPRMCIGRRFAELEIEVLVSKLIRGYRVEWNYGKMKVVSKMINSPGMPLKYKITEL